MKIEFCIGHALIRGVFSFGIPEAALAYQCDLHAKTIVFSYSARKCAPPPCGQTQKLLVLGNKVLSYGKEGIFATEYAADSEFGFVYYVGRDCDVLDDEVQDQDLNMCFQSFLQE